MSDIELRTYLMCQHLWHKCQLPKKVPLRMWTVLCLYSNRTSKVYFIWDYLQLFSLLFNKHSLVKHICYLELALIGTACLQNDLNVLFFFKFIYLFYLWLCWVFVSVRGLSPVAASGGHSSSRCAGLSLSRPLLLRSTGSRRAGSATVAHGPSCSAACGIFPDQCSNPCPLNWQADSQPLRHQGSPIWMFLRSLHPGLKAVLCSFIFNNVVLPTNKCN